jgi:hypothetical protein|tara:strand:+ start:427 stop:1038 length:612 start_codon:yes stop_codon:yes gene_type:complete
MAYNMLSGNVIAAENYIAGDALASGRYVISGNLSTSDAGSITNVARVTNPVNNGLITNVGGDANNITCESNLKFDGDSLVVTGDISSSVGISSSFYEGDGSRLTGVGRSMDINPIGNANGNLEVGFNYGTTAFDAARTWTTPASPTVGDVVRIKAPEGVSNVNTLTIEGYHNNTIDGTGSVIIESPFAAIALCYVSTGSYRLF